MKYRRLHRSAGTRRRQHANRPESRANLGELAAGPDRSQGGYKVETERRHSLSIPCPLSAPVASPRPSLPAPSPGPRAAESRAKVSACPPTYPAGRDSRPAQLLAAERDPAAPGTGDPARPACDVLTHPAFDRPPVLNVRRRGRMVGVVSLRRERTLRELAAVEAKQSTQAAILPHDVRGELLQRWGRPSGESDHERSVIAAAMGILDARLRQPGVVLDSPTVVRELLALWLAPRESEGFAVLFLDTGNALIERAVMFEGTLAQTAVYPREVARRALALNAAAVILAHNHPSGDPKPSTSDRFLTRVLKDALALVDVRVLDHFVVGRLSVLSMAERGLV